MAQLKSKVSDDGSRKLQKDFYRQKEIQKFKGIWGFGELTVRGMTLDSNKIAGMDGPAFKSYVMTAIRPLYPDVHDTPGKRVCLMVDLGPGRKDRPLLAELKTLGIYVISGVPNTTHITQPTDRNYGPFKSIYRENLRKLTVARQSNNQTIRTTDIPLLVFGGVDSSTGLNVPSSFEDAFAVDRSIKIRRTIGIYPYTRKCLGDSKVKHELIVLADGSIDVDADPLTYKLLDIERKNTAAIEFLTEHGFNAEAFRQQAPRNYQVKKMEVTVPHTWKRQDAIASATTQGGLYLVIKDGAVNTDDLFIADERSRRQHVIKQLKAKKKKADAFTVLEQSAKAFIAKCASENKEICTLPVSSLRVLFEWKLGKKPNGMKKSDLVAALNKAKSDPPAVSLKWSEEDDEYLQRIESEEIELKHTLVGKKTREMLQQSVSFLQNLTAEQIETADASPELLESVKRVQGSS